MQLDPTAPDPHDPLAPRPDDPVLFRRATRLYDRPDPKRSLVRTPLSIVAMLVLISIVAVTLILIARAML